MIQLENPSPLPWRTAVAGCGTIAPMHIRALAGLGRIELAGLADPDPQAAAAMADLWQKTAADLTLPPPACYRDINALLQEQQPDSVHICTPHHTHVPLAVAALAAGSHVLLEKPAGISLSDLEQLEQAEAESGRQLGLCFQNRFNLASLQAWLLIRAGLAGDLRSARGWVTWHRDAAYYQQAAWRGRWATEGGGVMINQAIHTLDLLIWLAGQPISVEGSISTHALSSRIEVEDTAECHLMLDGHIPALFYATNAFGVDAPVSLDLYGSELTIRLEADRLLLSDGQQRVLPDEETERLIREARLRLTRRELTAEEMFWLKAHDRQTAGHPMSPAVPDPAKAYWGLGHTRLIDAYYQSLWSSDADDTGRFPIGAVEGGRSLRTLLALYTSHREKRRITLSETVRQSIQRG